MTQLKGKTLSDWIVSDDAKHLSASINGQGRGDGYDVDVYLSKTTGRFFVRVWEVHAKSLFWYVAKTREGADAVGRSGYTPGSAPGNYCYITRKGQSNLKEVKALPR